MLWHNKITNELQSNPPWSGWLHPDKVAEQYPDWEQVGDDFIPPSPAKTDEQLLEEIRLERNRLLQESDKYMLSDFPVSETEREQWITYRQALRDFPESCNVHDLSFPTPPNMKGGI